MTVAKPGASLCLADHRQRLHCQMLQWVVEPGEQAHVHWHLGQARLPAGQACQDQIPGKSCQLAAAAAGVAIW